MTVLRYFLRDRRRSAFWWALGFLALAAFTCAFYPSIKGQQDLDEVVKDLPPAVQAMFGFEAGISLSSAPGYLQARMFASLYPILLVVLAIGAGAGAIGGNEEDGGLELLLSNPVSRLRVQLERFLGMAIVVSIQGVLFCAFLLPLAAAFGALDGVSIGGLLAATAGGVTLALLHGSMAFAIGAWTGRRSVAIGGASALAAAGYLAHGLLATADLPTAIRLLTPWYWLLHENLLAKGPNLSAWLPALLVSCAIAAGSVPRFLSRDLR